MTFERILRFSMALGAATLLAACGEDSSGALPAAIDDEVNLASEVETSTPSLSETNSVDLVESAGSCESKCADRYHFCMVSCNWSVICILFNCVNQKEDCLCGCIGPCVPKNECTLDSECGSCSCSPGICHTECVCGACVCLRD